MSAFINLTGLNHKKAYARERLTPNNSVVTPTTATIDNVIAGSAVMTGTDGGSQGLPPYGGKGLSALFYTSGAVYLTFEGTTPSATVGTPLAAGDIVLLEGYENIKKLKVFAASSIPVELTYFKE